MKRELTWKCRYDERSRQFPVRAVLDRNGRPKVETKSWVCPVWLDQLQEGSCVGHAMAHRLAAERLSVPGMTHEKALEIFEAAKDIDQWPGDNYDWTSVLAGAKATKKLYPAAFDHYRWCFDFSDLLHSLSHIGPVVLGIPWYSGMYDPYPTGFIQAIGRKVGGHAILATAVDVENKSVTLHNSWGSSWGKGGDCYIDWEDLENLFHSQSEACVFLT